MSTEPASAPTLKRALLYVLAYLLWLVSIAACVAAVIQLRATANALWAALGGDHYALGVVNQVSLLLGGLAALIYVMVLESYYRSGVRRGALLLRRFAVTIAAPLGVIVLSLVLLEVALRIMQKP